MGLTTVLTDVNGTVNFTVTAVPTANKVSVTARIEWNAYRLQLDNSPTPNGSTSQPGEVEWSNYPIAGTETFAVQLSCKGPGGPTNISAHVVDDNTGNGPPADTARRTCP